MSTKNLARTPLEGGRTGGSNYERHELTRRDRRRWKGVLHAQLRSDDDIDEPSRLRRWVDVEFRDRLGGPYRWLKKQNGRPWNDVYGELRQRFDHRTLAGRHILFDHLLRSVHGADHAGAREFGTAIYREYHVDEDGILRFVPYRWRQPRSEARREARGILEERFSDVQLIGGHPYRVSPTERWAVLRDRKGKPYRGKVATGAFRAMVPLRGEELKVFIDNRCLAR
jgi:hypothetical protein